DQFASCLKPFSPTSPLLVGSTSPDRSRLRSLGAGYLLTVCTEAIVHGAVRFTIHHFRNVTSSADTPPSAHALPHLLLCRAQKQLCRVYWRCLGCSELSMSVFESRKHRVATRSVRCLMLAGRGWGRRSSRRGLRRCGGRGRWRRRGGCRVIIFLDRRRRLPNVLGRFRWRWRRLVVGFLPELMRRVFLRIGGRSLAVAGWEEV